jgi:heterodisulfide reductase subunit C
MEQATKKFASSEPIKVSDSDAAFPHKVAKIAGTDLNACLTCLSCSGGCPMYQYMDYGPHGIMRLVVLGLKREALTSNTIWRCLGCHTCAAVCPMAINIASVMDYLRQECLAEKLPVGDKPLWEFYRSMLNTARRHGRVAKLELMVEHKIRTMGLGPKAWFQDVLLGQTMMLKHKLHFLPSRLMSSGRAAVRKILDAGPWANY